MPAEALNDDSVYLCPVSQLPSSLCLLVEFQVWIWLSKEILWKMLNFWTETS